MDNKQEINFTVEVSCIFGAFIVFVVRLVKSMFNLSKLISSFSVLPFLLEIICPLIKDIFLFLTIPLAAIIVML